MKHRAYFPAILAVTALLLACGSGSGLAQPVKHEHAISEDRIPAAIRNAVSSPDRPASDRALDAGRKPAQVMAFFGIRPGMRVADLSAIGGYTTELLSLVVGPHGKIYSQNQKLPARFAKAQRLWESRLKAPNGGNIVEIIQPFDSPHLLPVAPGSLDAVIMNMNYHDLVWLGVHRDRMNRFIYRALKKGGVYGVIDNSAQPGSGARDVRTLHRIDERFEIADITKAGFRLSETSDVLRNPTDDRTWPIFEHRGQQDRFVLKFVKP